MSKSIKNCFYDKLTFENLYSAHLRAKKGKCFRKEVILFELDLENNLINLLNKLKNGTYSIGKYNCFKIYEPKERIIKSLPYIDRVVQQFYVNEFIKPYFLKRFIPTTFACIDERGTHRAVLNVENNMRACHNNWNDYYVLKCDIRKFFYSIDRNILFNIMKKYISDNELLKLTHLFIFDNDYDSKSIAIGNYTSQYFANIYLHELDVFVKYDLKQKYYTRYMDDFIILVKTKDDAKLLLKKIEVFLNDNLNLKLNYKTRYYPSNMGCNFCGFRIFETHRLLRNSFKKNVKRKIREWNSIYNLNYNLVVRSSFNSFLGHMKHCNSYNFKNYIVDKCNFLYTDKFIFEMDDYLHSLIDNESIKIDSINE